MRYCVLAALALLFALPACSSSKATGTVPSDGFPAPDKEFVWNVAAEVLRGEGYTPDSLSSSQQTWTLVTHWNQSLQPFSGQGYRERVRLRIHDVPAQRDYYYLETQVVRQVNDDMRSPSSAICADWGDETRVPEKECLINNRIEMYFLPGCVSPQFRERYGIQQPQRGRIPVSEIRRTPSPEECPMPMLPSSTPSSQPSR